MSRKKDNSGIIREQQATYDTYAAMPDDGKRYEVLDGVLEAMSPGANSPHQLVSKRLGDLLTESCDSEYIILYAPLDVILSQTNVLQPDLIMIHNSREEIITWRGVDGPPDLAVEILSPGSRKRDKVRKLSIYARHQVPEYWIIDPQSRSLEQYVLVDSGQYELINAYEPEDTVSSDKISCVSFLVGDLFNDLIMRLLQ